MALVLITVVPLDAFWTNVLSGVTAPTGPLNVVVPVLVMPKLPLPSMLDPKVMAPPVEPVLTVAVPGILSGAL